MYQGRTQAGFRRCSLCKGATCTPLMQHVIRDVMHHVMIHTRLVSKWCSTVHISNEASSITSSDSLPLNVPEGKPNAESHAG